MRTCTSCGLPDFGDKPYAYAGDVCKCHVRRAFAQAKLEQEIADLRKRLMELEQKLLREGL